MRVGGQESPEIESLFARSIWNETELKAAKVRNERVKWWMSAEEFSSLDGGKRPKKLEAGQPASGVEGLPGTGCPLDPEPGLGGIFSLGLL